MTVQELIETLSKVSDKNKQVCVGSVEVYDNFYVKEEPLLDGAEVVTISASDH